METAQNTHEISRPVWKKRKTLLSDKLFGMVLVLPAVILLLLIVVYPVLQAVWLSLHDVQLTRPNGEPWVGLENYRRLVFDEPEFLQVWQNTLIFVAATTAGSFTTGFAMALALRGVRRAKAALRTLFLLPFVMPTIVLSLVWLWMFNSSFGVMNYMLDAVGLIDGFKPWFSLGTTAFVPVALLLIWKGGAFQMIMLTAGLSRVSQSLHEAAKVDGANAVRRFWHVTLPSMRPMIVTLLLLSFMFTMQQFTPLWLLTQGGPGHDTTTTAVWVYRIAFQRFDFGLAAALGTIWMALLIVLTLVAIKAGGKNE